MWNLPTSRYVKAFEPQLKARCCSEDTQISSSSSDDDEDNTMLPEIVPISSSGSFSDSTISSERASPATLSTSPVSPRSIFKNYWDSPSSCSGGGGGENLKAQKGSRGTKEEELLHKLSSLSLPLVGGDDEDDEQQPSSTTDGCTPKTSLMRSSSAQAAPSPNMVNTKAFRRPYVDDSNIDYGRDKKRPGASTPRRQILPTVVTPPPPSAVPTRELPRVVALREQTQRPWSSTTTLLKRPTHSCLRPSRYSCSMIDERELAHQHQDETSEDAAAAIAARAALSRSKSVSFYSQVSVFEFVKYGTGGMMEPSKDWSKYFGS